MTPSEVRMIAFFFDKVIPRDGSKDEDWEFIFELDCKQITYELTEEEHCRLFALYDNYAPNKDDYYHVTNMVKILKDIESVKVTFMSVDGTPVFETEEVIP